MWACELVFRTTSSSRLEGGSVASQVSTQRLKSSSLSLGARRDAGNEGRDIEQEVAKFVKRIPGGDVAARGDTSDYGWTIIGSKVKRLRLLWSTFTLTQCTPGLPNVQRRVKFGSRLVGPFNGLSTLKKCVSP